MVWTALRQAILILQYDAEPTPRVLGKLCYNFAITATIETGLSSTFTVAPKTQQHFVANSRLCPRRGRQGKHQIKVRGVEAFRRDES